MGRAAHLGDTMTRKQAALLPLFGIPSPSRTTSTSLACRRRPPADFAYMPERTCRRPKTTGCRAILIGKTNLDQFATGLVGVRSPYGVPRNPFDARYAPSGSSSARPSRSSVWSAFRSAPIRRDPGASSRLQQHRGIEADQGRLEHDRRCSGLPLARLRLDLRAHQRRCRRRLRRGERPDLKAYARPVPGQAAPGEFPLRCAAGG